MLLASCSASKKLQKAEIYLMNEPNLEFLQVDVNPGQEPLDPMAYQEVFGQKLREGLRAEGLNLVEPNVEEGFDLNKERTTALNLGVVLIREEMSGEIGPGEPVADGPPMVKVVEFMGSASRIKANGKEVSLEFNESFTIDLQTQRKLMKDYPDLNDESRIVQHTAYRISEEIKKQLLKLYKK